MPSTTKEIDALIPSLPFGTPIEIPSATRSIMDLWTAADEDSVHKSKLSDEDKILYNRLCDACRKGDLLTVDLLINSYGIDVNVIDEWDYTPLMLASLCGHESIVKYLLEHGAKCDRDTFQGERCIYAALTDRIRLLLLKFDISKAVNVAQPYAAHISSLFTQKKPNTSDICFNIYINSNSIVNSNTKNTPIQTFNLHKFFILARCPNFGQNLNLKWRETKTANIRLNSSEEVQAFIYLLKKMYLIHFTNISHEVLKKLIREVSKQFDMDELLDKELDSNESNSIKNGIQTNPIRRVQIAIKNFLDKNILSNKLRIKNHDEIDTHLLENMVSNAEADAILRIQLSNSNEEVYYPVHRAFLIRSDYFKTMFSSSFLEANLYTSDTVSESKDNDSDEPEIATLTIDIFSIQVMEIVLNFLYTDNAEIPSNIAMDVLAAADVLIIDRLKSYAAASITSCGNTPPTSIYNILRAGWSLRVERLERYAAEYFANNLKKFINEPEFAEIIMESADRINARQLIDTVELIDDMRFYLEKKYESVVESSLDPTKLLDDEETFVNRKAYYHDLELIEDLLEKLELE